MKSKTRKAAGKASLDPIVRAAILEFFHWLVDEAAPTYAAEDLDVDEWFGLYEEHLERISANAINQGLAPQKETNE